MKVDFFLLLIIFNTIYVYAILDRSIVLNDTQPGGNGMSILLTENHVNNTNNIWNINPQTQDGTDLTIEISFGFHLEFQSQLHLIIDGMTPNITKNNGEFIIVFSVDQTQYFGISVQLKNDSFWKIYPNPKTSLLATVDNIFGTIIGQSGDNRYNRISQNTNWTDISHKKPLKWPLNIKITNDPVNNISHIQCTASETILNVIYNSSFIVNRPMDIYIMNAKSDNKPFIIYSVKIEYSYYTLSPTLSPSKTPTQIPTHLPTQTPTYIPTHTPTYSPITDGKINDIKTTQMIDITSTVLNTATSDNALIYIIIIIALSVCICIILLILIIKKLRKHRNKKNEKNLPNQKDYKLQKQIAQSVEMDNKRKHLNPNDSSSNESMYNDNKNNHLNVEHYNNVATTPTPTSKSRRNDLNIIGVDNYKSDNEQNINYLDIEGSPVAVINMNVEGTPDIVADTGNDV
eukprot:346416_1